MKIYLTDIAQASSELLKILEKEKIEKTKDLERMTGTVVGISQKDHVRFLKTPSNLRTTAYTVSYVRARSELPIELKVNPELDYSQVLLKAQTTIEGYKTFQVGELDKYRNIRQYKAIMSPDFNLVKKELERLSKLKP